MLPSKRLKPVLIELPNGSSLWYDTVPSSFWPPERVVYAMTPDCASPNSTPMAPVVTDASSTALVPTVIACEPAFWLRTGVPSM